MEATDVLKKKIYNQMLQEDYSSKRKERQEAQKTCSGSELKLSNCEKQVRQEVEKTTFLNTFTE